MENIGIRPFEDADMAAMARLMTELGYPTSPQEMSQRMALIGRRSDFATFTAALADEVVGVVGACVTPSYEHEAPSGRIVALVVAERFRGHGVGALLMNDAESWLIGNEVGRIVVDSGLARSGAHAFYRHRGYTQTGLRFVKVVRR